MTTTILRNDHNWNAYDDDNRGTSTSDDEAPLRDIGRAAFSISYPKDVTPRKGLKRLHAPNP